MSGTSGQEEREGKREGGTDRQKEGGNSAAAGGAMRAPREAARPPNPTPGFCSREVRVLLRSGAWATGWGPGRGAEERDWVRSAPACGYRGRWGTSTAQDDRPGRGLHSPHGKQYDSGLSDFTRVELEGAPASPFNCGWVLDAERRGPNWILGGPTLNAEAPRPPRYGPKASHKPGHPGLRQGTVQIFC